jgi:hypothetical protein
MSDASRRIIPATPTPPEQVTFRDIVIRVERSLNRNPNRIIVSGTKSLSIRSVPDPTR